MSDTIKKLYDWVEQNQDRLVEDLRTYVRQACIPTQGIGIQEGAEMTCQILRDLGADAKIYETEGCPVVLGYIEGECDKTVMLYAHYDVQPPEPLELWDYPPFSAELVDGNIYARGSSDCRGNLMINICALRAYMENGMKPPTNILFFIEGEEESGSTSLEPFMRKNLDLLKADTILDVDESVQPDGKEGRPKVITGGKGNCAVELRCTIRRELHSKMAVIIKNPIWRMVQALATIRDENDNITIDNFFDDIRENTPTEHAIIEEAATYWDESTWRDEAGVPQYLRGLTGADALKELYFAPSCNINSFKGGYLGEGGKNIVPDYATVRIDFRTVPVQECTTIVEKLRAHLDRRGYTDIELTMVGESRWFRCPVEHPGAMALRQAIRDGFGGEPAVMVNYAGSGPGELLDRVLGIPQVATGFGPLGDFVHGPNEHMSVDFYLRGIKTIISYFDIYANMDEK